MSGIPRGLTLLEVVIAMAILAAAVLGVSQATSAGHQQLRAGQDGLRATALAEALMEEITSRPFTGGAAGRANWAVDDFDGFAEAAGALTHADGSPCDAADQAFGRSVTVTATSVTVPELDGAVVGGATVDVVVSDADGRTWALSRFVAQ